MALIDHRDVNLEFNWLYFHCKGLELQVAVLSMRIFLEKV